MDNRLVLTFLFVMLAGGFMGTYAQSNATTTASTNVTTTASTNVTIAASTNATTAASTNATTAATVGTAATAASAAPTTTSAAPFNPNSTVTNLTTPISASNCGKTQLCARQPSGCDPTSGTGCFFLGVQQLNGQNFEFSLSGNSGGYIAAILSTTVTLGNNATTYICANNNGVVQYFSALLNNGTLNNTTLPVNNVRGSVNGSKIQCIFAVTVPDSSQKAAAFYSVSVATGPFNASTGVLGSPTFQLRTNPVDLTNLNATITNVLANTTTTANTTAAPTVATTNNAITIQQSLMRALLITVGVLSLTML